VRVAPLVLLLVVPVFVQQYSKTINTYLKITGADLANLKKELNTALKTSAVDENTNNRTGLPRRALLDIKNSILGA